MNGNKDPMRKIIFTSVALALIAGIAGAAEELLVSVALDGKPVVSRWKNEGVPARLFLEGQAFAVTDAKTVNHLKSSGYAVEIITSWDNKGYYWVARNGIPANKQPPGRVIWQKGRSAIVQGSPGKSHLLPDPHRYQPFPSGPLPERYWDQILLARVAPARLGPDAEIQALVDQVNSDTLTEAIQRMQDFNTRLALSDSCLAAEDWLKQKLEAYGYSAEYDSFYHARSLYFAEAWPGAGYERNVLAKRTGTFRPGHEFVICGHLDATTLGGYSHPADTSICRTDAPGADDNATGSAATLEIARICQGASFNPSVTYALWAAEESYLLGSAHYAASAQSLGTDLRGVVNMDMVGWMNDASIDIDVGSSDPFSQWLNDLYKEAALLYAPELTVYQGMGNGSDDMSFADRGYPALMLIADYYAGFNPYYHTTDETIDKLNPLLYTAVTKASLAVTAIVGLYPGPVDSVKCRDIGDGSSLLLSWQPSPEGDVAGYKIYRGMSSGYYSDTVWVAGQPSFSDTVNGLYPDSTYYFAVTAVGSDDRESYDALEVIGTPKSSPLAPSGLVATPVDSGIRLVWERNLELDLAGYNIYRRINGSSFDSLTTTTDTFLLNKPLSGANRYYYKIQAKDSDGNEGVLSDSVFGRPITLDQGILLVDETNNWTTGSFPRDAQQDSLYNYIMAGYKYEQYEYGTSLQKPILADFGPYSTVAWLADDYAGLLAWGAVNDLKSYLEAGGKLWYAGWKPSGDLHNSITFPADYTAGDVSYDHFKIIHAELSGATDSFKTAIGLNDYPDMSIDTLKYPASTLWGKTFRSIEALTPLAGSDTIYVMDMKNDGSPYQGRACAVRDSGKTVFFGFPMYFMDKDQARLAVQKVMEDLGEPYTGVEGKPGANERTANLSLWQNNPNPFAGNTVIKYQVDTPGPITLKIYNISGQLVKKLDDGYRIAGIHSVKWDGRDESGTNVSKGVYIYQLQTTNLKQTRKLIVLR